MQNPDADTRLVADFVRRLRRVALHPLALAEHGDEDSPPEPGNLLRWYMEFPTEQEEHADGTVTLRSPLPDEVQFESLATRVRVLTLPGDRLHWSKALDALDRLIGSTDPLLLGSSRDLREEWRNATDRTSRARAYHVGYQSVTNPEETETLTDIDLAYAWLYQDVAHGDASRTGLFSVLQRYRAAVSVFSHTAVIALETLHYINHLIEAGVVDLPVGTFFEKVIVTDSEHSMTGRLIMTPVGDDLTDPVLLGSVPEELMPAFELAQRSVQARADDPESEVVTLKNRPSPAGDA